MKADEVQMAPKHGRADSMERVVQPCFALQEDQPHRRRSPFREVAGHGKEKTGHEKNTHARSGIPTLRGKVRKQP